MLAICSPFFREIPEAIPPGDYEDLLPSLATRKTKIDERKENDWSDEYLSPTTGEQIFTEIEREELIDWYEERILSLEALGYLLDALHLCHYALEVEDLSHFSSVHRLLHLQFLLNNFSEELFTFEQMRQFDEETLLRVLLTFPAELSPEEIERRLENVFLPSMEHFPSLLAQLTNIAVEKMTNQSDLVPLLRFLKNKKIFTDTQEEQLIRTLILNLNSPSQLNAAQQLLPFTQHKADLEHLIE